MCSMLDGLWPSLDRGGTATYARVSYTLGGHSLCPPLGFQSVLHPGSVLDTSLKYPSHYLNCLSPRASRVMAVDLNNSGLPLMLTLFRVWSVLGPVCHYDRFVGGSLSFLWYY